MNCWGWVHKKYWNRLVKNPNFFLKKFTEKDIQKFDLEGRLNNWSQLIKNKNYYNMGYILECYNFL